MKIKKDDQVCTLWTFIDPPTTVDWRIDYSSGWYFAGVPYTTNEECVFVSRKVGN